MNLDDIDVSTLSFNYVPLVFLAISIAILVGVACLCKKHPTRHRDLGVVGAVLLVVLATLGCTTLIHNEADRVDEARHAAEQSILLVLIDDYDLVSALPTVPYDVHWARNILEPRADTSSYVDVKYSDGMTGTYQVVLVPETGRVDLVGVSSSTLQ